MTVVNDNKIGVVAGEGIINLEYIDNIHMH